MEEGTNPFFQDLPVPVSTPTCPREMRSIQRQQQWEFPSISRQREGAAGHRDGGTSVSSTPGPSLSWKSKREWETRVLFTVKLSQLDVDINMGNVMGNTV